ncbi:peptide chain release factor N(5)-glutamine methyltransferase [Ornithinimicrobium pratense]|uniref:Release factor glutamine methyltransferase n=1 Tax=Ornithinimicrobium pratense TaxID=2593973 RepID=A0A5J6V3T8_9MICO|nr:peptide chain release factor N(5)-glutamine methyltransferase [Ornithinimicrobium pratense]QFG67822.1 peptide chain release factor N(5)-glutamine methyltransferase [Ornithinimicrobium pratense]
MSPGVDRAARWGTAELARAQVPSPAVDAEHLLAHATGRDVGELRRERLLGRDIDEATLTAYRSLVERRAARVPLQHLTGTAHFAGLDLSVGPGVFTPRPETETLLNLALGDLEGVAHPVVLDLCTGSGALALAVAAARPDARVGAVELSPQAHRYAATNLAAHPAGRSVELRLGRAQEAFPELCDSVDVITCNPPYIPPDAEPVDPEAREHDPELALYGGGVDGLEVPRQIAGWALRLLRPGGVLLMEHADAQGESLPAALRELGFADVADHPDLGGRPRVSRGARP